MEAEKKKATEFSTENHGRDIGTSRSAILEQDGGQEHLTDRPRGPLAVARWPAEIQQPGQWPEQPAQQIEQGVCFASSRPSRPTGRYG